MKLIPNSKLAAKLFAVLLAVSLALVGAPFAAFAEELAVADVPEIAAEEVVADEETAPIEEAAPAEEKAPVSLTANNAEVVVLINVEVVGEDGVAVNWFPTTSIEVPEGTDALTATTQVLDAQGLTYDIQWGSFLNSITNEDGVTCETAADYSVYWQFLVNGAYSSVGADSYTLSRGDIITWHFGAANEPTNPSGPDYDTETAPADVDIEWARFEDNGNVTDAPTPTEVVEEWKTLVGGTSGASDLVIADGYIFVAIGSSWNPSAEAAKYAMKLVKIDIETGEIVATTWLASDIDYTCRPIVWGGLVYIPLSGGSVQAVNVQTMKTYWVSAAAEDGGQSTTSLNIYSVESATGEYDEQWNPVTEQRDVLFFGTAVFDSTSYSYTRGTLMAVDALTGAIHGEWSYANYSAGFYWTNTVMVGSYLITADTAGVVHCITGGSWAAVELGSVALSDRVVSDLALYNDDVLVTTGDGTLWRIAVSADGALSVVSSVKAVSNCTAGPVVTGTYAIVVGASPVNSLAKAAGDPTAAVAIVDLETMTVVQLITTADGEALPTDDYSGKGIAAPALVSEQDGKTIVYFTLYHGEYDETWTYCTDGGEVFWFELGEDEAHLLYDPEGDVAQYCDSPLIADASGALYYLNDSGHVVKLAADKPDDPVDPEPVNPQPADDTPTDTEPANNAPANNAPANNAPAQQRGGVPATGDATVSGISAFVLATALLGAAGMLRRKEN